MRILIAAVVLLLQGHLGRSPSLPPRQVEDAHEAEMSPNGPCLAHLQEKACCLLNSGLPGKRTWYVGNCALGHTPKGKEVIKTPDN